jgi:Protein of unknown function (DUF4231)
MPESTANNDQTLERLDNQICWYDIHSGRQRRSFYSLKIVTVVAAASIPFLAAILPDDHLNKIVISSLGALIVVIEGTQQLFQLQTNWTLYRSTCESLKREKYLYLGDAGPYTAAQNPHSLLAERVESLISKELAGWTSSQQASQQGGNRANHQSKH